MNLSPNPNLGKEVRMTSAKQLRSRVRRNSQARFCRRGWGSDSPLDSTALSEDRRYITFRDGFEAGTFKLWGTRDLHYYQIQQIKRVRVVRRTDGYYVQFCLDVNRLEQREPTGKTIGLDVGLSHFYTDSNGSKVENPRYLRKSEKALKRARS